MAKRSDTLLPTIFVLGALALPTVAFGAVDINEVMYDPPGSDAKQEWVELYNAGSDSVDLTGWKFVDGGSATKHGLNAPPKNGGAGSLVLLPGDYAIMADDAATFVATYPSVTTVIDSTMSMPDVTGTSTATLELFDAQGDVEDSLMYGFDAYAENKGGTLQRLADGTLISALPTPGLANATVAYVPPDTGGDSSSGASPDAPQASQTSTAPVSSYVPPPVPTLFVDAGSDRTVMVGADVEFDGWAYDRDQHTLSDVRFNWNFGDGATAEGSAVLHHFDYPGRYAVVLTVAQDKTAVPARITVLAEPPKLALSLLPSGGVAIRNLAGRDLDLSHWILAQAGRQFFLPDHSIILAGASMNISQATLGFWSNSTAELEYPNGKKLLGAGESTATSTSASLITAPTAAAPHVAAAVPVAQKPSASRNTPAKAVIHKTAPALVKDTVDSPASAAAALGVASPLSTPVELALFGVGALAVLVAAGVWYVQATAPTPVPQSEPVDADALAEEFEIIVRE